MKKGRIWISWNVQRRNIGLAEAVGAQLFMSEYAYPRWLRIPIECLRSWHLIRKERPKICFTMNPSIFASWWLSILAKFYPFFLISDLHTLNKQLSGMKKRIFFFFFDSGIKNSKVVIVTNAQYRKLIYPLNANIVCIPDALPVIRETLLKTSTKSSGKHNKTQVLFVCSFDQDEPVDEVISLDAKLNGFELLVSGNWKKKYATLPETQNIRFLGFISRSEYDQTLCSVDGMLVLTKEEGCLCCGAYEAFSAGKPLILSQTETLRHFFGEAPIYTENNSDSILSALNTLRAEQKMRTASIIDGRRPLQIKFAEGIQSLEDCIVQL